MNYQLYENHRLMLRDEARTEAFRASIAEIVRPGDVVMDLGAGTGVLALFAAQAGASRVYAVEMQPVASMAAHLADLNGFGDVIHVLQADIRDVQLPEKVDVIVSEWMGSIGVDENMLGAVLWARDHHLKPGGQMIPQTVTAHMAPVTTSQRADVGFFDSDRYGVDLGPLREPALNELMMIRRRVSPDDITVAAKEMWTSDVVKDDPDTVREPYVANLNFRARKACRASALAAWFTAQLSPAVELSTAPSAPDTHWGQLMLPLSRELQLKARDVLEVEVQAMSIGPGPLHFAWSIRVNDGEWEHHDTTNGMFDLRPEPFEPEAPPERSELCRFLASLAIDTDMLSAFLRDPDAVLSEHKISAEHQAALKSQDPHQVHEALYIQGGY